MKTLSNFFYISVTAITIAHSIACKKQLLVDPPTRSVNSETVFKEDLTAAAAMTAIYTNIANGFSFGGITNITPKLGTAADELTLFYNQNGYANFYINALMATNGSDVSTWSSVYPIIYQCNAVLEGVTRSTSLTPSVKKQILAEAKFIRGFLFFYLTNLYGSVPLTLTTDYKVNAELFRASEENVYAQIKTDLKDASANLSENYLNSDETTTSSERLRPNKFAAQAFLARVNLYSGDYTNAEIEANSVLSNTSVYDTIPIANTFLKNTKETIWCLQQVVIAGRNTDEARLFNTTVNGPNSSQPFYLSDSLYLSFESGDKRQTGWIGTRTMTNGTIYRYPAKYKAIGNNQPITEHLIALRVGELYLIRAEARANLNKLTEARNDLNVIRKRAGLPNNTTTDQTMLISDIIKERRHELFVEWGHRWLDLKRKNLLDGVMTIYTPLKGGTWNANSKLFPIPTTDLLTAKNLKQNPGYEE